MEFNTADQYIYPYRFSSLYSLATSLFSFSYITNMVFVFIKPNFKTINYAGRSHVESSLRNKTKLLLASSPWMYGSPKSNFLWQKCVPSLHHHDSGICRSLPTLLSMLGVHTSSCYRYIAYRVEYIVSD